jgi:hypothetical protein
LNRFEAELCIYAICGIFACSSIWNTDKITREVDSTFPMMNPLQALLSLADADAR